MPRKLPIIPEELIPLGLAEFDQLVRNIMNEASHDEMRKLDLMEGVDFSIAAISKECRATADRVLEPLLEELAQNMRTGNGWTSKEQKQKIKEIELEARNAFRRVVGQPLLVA